MSQIAEYIKIAVMNIRHNKGRSILTMLGIIIGISSVIMVLAIGNGVRNEINGELDGMFGGQIVFYVDTTRKDTTITFDESDVEAICSQVDGINGASPSFGGWGTAESPKVSCDLRFKGGNTYLVNDTKDPIIKGHYFTQSDFEAGNSVCVISESHARKLFGTTDVVGMTFEATMWGQTEELKVVGIRKDSAASLINSLNGGDFVDAEVPYTFLGYKFFYYIDELDQIYVYAQDPASSNEVARQVKTLLETRHKCGGTNQILMESFADYSAQYDSILNYITVFVSLVAAISLLVGGIGVMNIMLVSVTERTREIGIRKSLGARTASIMLQFLAEAGIIALIGGVIGIVIGVAGAVLISSVMGMNATISPVTVIVTSLFSCGIGVFFGIYPAKKAAALRPIEALRHE